VKLLVDKPTLVDRKPTQLQAAIIEVCPRGQEDSVFMLALYLQKLPADVKILLVHMDHTCLKELATAGDQLVVMRTRPAAAVEADPGEVAAVAAQGPHADAGRQPAAVKQKKKKQQEELEPSKDARLAAGLWLRHWRPSLQLLR
jgi:hypothetical protein